MVNRRSLKIGSAFAVTLALACQLLLAMAGVGVTPSMDDKTRVVINIPSRTLWVYEGDKIVRYFPVGVGRPGFMTPMGKFKVIRKIIDPGWEHPYQAPGKIRIAPGENNPLGTRWIGFHQKGGGEYGMHGTDNPASVGKFSSHGCVRMKIPDVEALFEMVNVGTPVEVTYETVLVRPQGNDMRLVVYKDLFRKGMPSAAQVRDKILKQYPDASVDMTKIQAALRQPNERPFLVGSANVASEPFASDAPKAEPPLPSSARSPFDPLLPVSKEVSGDAPKKPSAGN